MPTKFHKNDFKKDSLHYQLLNTLEQANSLEENKANPSLVVKHDKKATTYTIALNVVDSKKKAVKTDALTLTQEQALKQLDPNAELAKFQDELKAAEKAKRPFYKKAFDVAVTAVTFLPKQFWNLVTMLKNTLVSGVKAVGGFFGFGKKKEATAPAGSTESAPACCAAQSAADLTATADVTTSNVIVLPLAPAKGSTATELQTGADDDARPTASLTR